jgi:O-antigen/teichoic acid export membrane protein
VILSGVQASADRQPTAAGGFFGLFVANIFAQTLSFAAYPLLTRIYTPEQMGVLGVVMFGTLLLTPLSSLRYEIALPLCRSDREAAAVLTLSLSTVVLTSVLMAAVLIAPPARVIALLGPAAPYRFFLPLALFAFGAYNVLVYEATRLGDYLLIARTRMSQAVSGPLLQIVLGAAGFATAGLLVGFAVGLSAGSLRLAWRLVIEKALFTGTSIREVVRVAVLHRHFALFSSWAGVLANSINLGNLLFAALYGTAVGGFIYLGDRVLMQPLRISGNAFLQVFVGEAGRVLKSQPRALLPLFAAVLWKQAALSVIWLSAVYVLAATAMPMVFGRDWGPAAHYMRAMMIGYLVTAACLPISHTLLLLGKQRLAALLDAMRVAALVASIAVSLRSGASPLAAVANFYITQAVAQCLILAVIVAQVRGASHQRPLPAMAS